MSEQPKSAAQHQNTIPIWSQFRWQLTMLLAFLVITPAVIVPTIFVIQASDQSSIQIQTQLESVARLKRDQIARWLDDSQSSLNLILANQDRIDMVKALITVSLSDEALSQDQGTQLIINNLLVDAIEARPTFKELFIYNTKGQVIAASAASQLGKVVSRQPYFKGSLVDNYVQAPFYEIGSGELAVFVTRPVFDDNGQVAGVLAGKLNIDTLGEIMTDRSGLGENGETYLVSRESNYLLTPSRFEGYPLIRAYHSEGIDQALNGESGTGEYNSYREPAAPVFGAYLWVPELQAGLLAEMDRAEALAPFVPARNSSILIALITALVAVTIGFYATTRVTKPIVWLTEVATKIAGGDLNQRARIYQRNEVGLLASVFNQMTAQLQELIDSLEERVADRTRRLEIVANLSEQLIGILEVDQLLEELVGQVKKQFGYYHAHVYLVDENRQNLIMRAGSGEAGRQMKAQGYHIAMNVSSLVVSAVQTGEIARVDNVRESKDWLPNPLLPNTYSEMAVPIILEGEVVGVLDVQEDKIAGLDESDASLLRSLANQVAVTIRNARLFAEVQIALAEAQVAQERYLARAWGVDRQTREQGAYHYQRSSATRLDELFARQVEQEALERDRAAVIKVEAAESEREALVAPIKVQSQVIGSLQLHDADPDRQWSEWELALVERVTDQAAQVAENLRLFEETRERAGREQAIREITDKLRAATSLEELVKITSHELGERLSAEHTVMELGLEPESNSTSASELERNGQHKSKP
jgi:GAF domain-containing protein